jgi:hypothetical protein
MTGLGVPVAQHGHQQPGAVAERQIDRLAADPRLGRDLGLADIEPAAGRDQVPRRIQDGDPGLFADLSRVDFTNLKLRVTLKA